MNVLTENLPHNTGIILSASVIFLLVCFSSLIISYGRRSKYPTVGTVNADFRDVIEKGVRKYPDTPFYLSTQDPVLILPKSAVNDIKILPNKICSMYEIFKKDFHQTFTGFPETPNLIISVINKDLREKLQYSLDKVQDELKYSFDKEFGSCEDWKSLVIHKNFARIIALVNGRAFVGRPLSRNDEWLDMSVNYTLQVMVVKNILHKWPIWMRDIVGPHLKEVKSLRRYQKRVIELSRPLVDAHLAKDKNEKLYSECGDEEGNIISWYLSRIDPDDSQLSEIICNNILITSFVSIHTTSSTIIQAIFDLASYRVYIPILLEEIHQVIKEDGSHTKEDGSLKLQKSSLSRLSKLDSFIKESQRMNNLSLVSHERQAMVDFKLSNGCLIPKRTRIAIPSWVIHHESTSLFLAGYTKKLSEFDGLRFHNLRRIPGNENRHYFVSTSPDSLAFGHGNHACPGRFFASNVIKLVLIEFLRNWEFRFPDDRKLQAGACRRPKNIFVQLDCLPDLLTRVEVRRKRI